MHSFFVIGDGFKVELCSAVPKMSPNGGIGYATMSINGPWRVSALCGGPALPASRTLERLVGLETFDEFFSGTVLYRTMFDVGGGHPIRLSLGDVREIARVRLNGGGVRFPRASLALC